MCQGQGRPVQMIILTDLYGSFCQGNQIRQDWKDLRLPVLMVWCWILKFKRSRIWSLISTDLLTLTLAVARMVQSLPRGPVLWQVFRQFQSTRYVESKQSPGNRDHYENGPLWEFLHCASQILQMTLSYKNKTKKSYIWWFSENHQRTIRQFSIHGVEPQDLCVRWSAKEKCNFTRNCGLGPQKIGGTPFAKDSGGSACSTVQEKRMKRENNCQVY